ncbi:MAG TPA: outer membrane protein assembly factor BamD [Candidatus Krumholzibacteria bacterium]|nr:outer membrane protein assembly factor BamD [Candidatus Krumholzibacteria bacterium]
MRGWRICAVLALAALSASCAGGVSKIPATPGAVLAKGDDYLRRGKDLQAVTMYQKFLEKYVGNERADYAQYKLAESYLAGHEYELAAVEYQVLITNYGYSEWVDDALFQTGVCLWRQAPRVERDQQKAVDALGRFNQYLTTYPDSSRAPEARTYVRQINARLAEKALISARWYYRRKEPKASMIYCDKVINNYPDNKFWEQALYLKGVILVDRGQNEDGIAQFTRLIEATHNDALKRDAQEQIKRARQ